MPRTIVAVKIADIEKRRLPSKHYVYVIYVTWSDGSTNVIYRRYSRFFDFQSKLMDMFPEESGSLDPRKRIIPFLPGKKLFGRSHIREVALKRLKPIGEYCQALLKLPSKISEHKEVIQFFEIDADDINPSKEQKKLSVNADKISLPRALEHYIAVDDYTKQEKGEINLVAGMLVEIVEKTESGWWFVNAEDQQGWVPSTYLEREDGMKEDMSTRARPGEEEKYLCTDPFEPTSEDEIAMECGAVVDVIEKNLKGWWLVRYNGKEGYVPATNLVKTEAFHAHVEELKRKSQQEGTGIQIIGSLLDVSDLLNKDVVRTKEEEHEQTEAIYEEIRKTRSLKREGSIRPPPRQSVRVSSIKSQPVAADPHRSSLMKRVYITIADFSDPVGDGISFKAGQEVELLEKSDSGWWFVKIQGVEGWAPVTYIQETAMTVEGSEPRENFKNAGRIPVIQENAQSDDSDWEDGDQENEEENRPQSKMDLATALKSQLAGQNRASDPPTKPSLSPKPPAKQMIAKKVDKEEDAEPKPSLSPKPPAKQMIAKKVDKEEDAETKLVTAEKESLGTALKPRFERVFNNSTNKSDVNSKKPACSPKPGVSQSAHDTEENTKGISNLQEVLQAKIESRQKQLEKDDSDAEKPNILPVAKKQGASVALQPPSATRKPSPQRPSTPPDFYKLGQNSGGRASSPMQEIKRSFSPHNYKDRPRTEIKSETDVQKKSKERSESPSTIRFEQEANSRQDRLNMKPPPPPAPPSQAKPKISPKFPNRDSGIEGSWTGNVKSMFETQGDTKTPLQKGDFPFSTTTNLKSRFETQEPKKPVNPDSSVPVTGTRNIKAVFEPKETKKTTGQNSDVPTSGTRNIKAVFEQKGLQKPSNTPKPSTVPKPGIVTKPSTVPKPAVLKKVTKSEDNEAVQNVADYRSKLGNSFLPSQTECSKMGSVDSQGSNKPSVPLKSQTSSNIVKPSLLSIKPSASNQNIGEKNVTSSMTTNFTPVLERCIAVASFVAQNEGEVGLVEGDEVQILDKAEGWWYVKNGENEGWAPADFIQEKGSNTGNSDHIKQMHNSIKTESISDTKQQERHYKATANFVAENDGEIGFSEGEEIEVLDTSDGDWWYVKIRNSEGWAPATYIKEIV